MNFYVKVENPYGKCYWQEVKMFLSKDGSKILLMKTLEEAGKGLGKGYIIVDWRVER